MRKQMLISVALLAAVGCKSPCPPDALSAAQVAPTMGHILDDQEKMIAGTLDPAALTDLEKEVMLGDIEIVREVLSVAALRASAVSDP